MGCLYPISALFLFCVLSNPISFLSRSFYAVTFMLRSAPSVIYADVHIADDTRPIKNKSKVLPVSFDVSKMASPLFPTIKPGSLVTAGASWGCIDPLTNVASPVYVRVLEATWVDGDGGDGGDDGAAVRTVFMKTKAVSWLDCIQDADIFFEHHLPPVDPGFSANFLSGNGNASRPIPASASALERSQSRHRRGLLDCVWGSCEAGAPSAESSTSLSLRVPSSWSIKGTRCNDCHIVSARGARAPFIASFVMRALFYL